MKNFVRAFVLSLVVTGAVASSHIAQNRTDATVSSAKVSALPIPVCPPDDPDACHITDLQSGK